MLIISFCNCKIEEKSKFGFLEKIDDPTREISDPIIIKTKSAFGLKFNLTRLIGTHEPFLAAKA